MQLLLLLEVCRDLLISLFDLATEDLLNLMRILPLEFVIILDLTQRWVISGMLWG